MRLQSNPIVLALRKAGFDVKLSIGVLGRKAQDLPIQDLAFLENRVILTEDTDFAENVVRFGHPTVGIVRFALEPLPRDARIRRAVNALIQLGDQVCGAIATVEPTRTRHRPLPAPEKETGR